MTHDERILELISAYIDGELSADERARVDQLLAGDAQLRVYHQQLLSVRQSVVQLPTYRLPDNFSEAVMRRAEREMLAARPSAAAAPPVSALPVSSASSATSSPATGRRRLWFAIVAVAASLLLTATWYSLWKQRRDDGPDLVKDRPAPSAGGDTNRLATGPGSSSTATPSDIAGNTNDRNNDSNNSAANRDANHDDAVATSNGTEQRPEQDTARPPAGSSLVDGSSNNRTPPTDPPESDSQSSSIPMVTMVVDLVLPDREITQAAQLPDVFVRSLERAGIRLQNAIPVDARMEPALLSHRYFGEIRTEQLPRPLPPDAEARPKKYLQLVFVVARGRQFDEVLQFLMNAEQTGAVLDTRMDMAMGESSSQLYVQMERLSKAAGEGNEQQVLAHPLAMEEEMRSRLLAALTAAGWKDGPHDALDDPTAPQPPQRPEDLPLPDNGPASDAVAAMEQLRFQVLFVIRSESSVRKTAAPAEADDNRKE
jgi:negative regulator of sigma E activity